jgi:predicted lactoylglutathione lyase
MSVPQRISIVTFAVADLAASTSFYEALGWRKSSSSLDSITFFQTDGSVLGLYERAALAEDAGVDPVGSGFNGVTCALNCSSTDEVDDVFGSWVAAGATPMKQPHTAFWGGYSSYVADPDGHLWEIAHNPYASIGPDGRMQIGDPVD